MEQDPITTLVEDLSVSEELAQFAVSEANGKLEPAREILERLLPNYLFIKIRYLSGSQIGNGGLVFILLQKDPPDFVIFRTVVDSDREWLQSVTVYSPPEDFYQVIRDYFNEHQSGYTKFDAGKLKDAISTQLNPSSLQYIFGLWEVPRTSVIDPDDPTETFDNPGDVLHTTFNEILNNVLVDNVDLELDYTFYTEDQLNEIREVLALVSKSEKQESGSETAKGGFDKLKINLKGRLTIDPVAGVMLKDLEVGDTAYCEIMDRSDVAVSIGKLIGAYKLGFWQPVKAVIVELNETGGDRIKAKLIIARGVHINTISFSNIKVQCAGMTANRRAKAASESDTGVSFLPLLVAVILLVIFIIFFMALR